MTDAELWEDILKSDDRAWRTLIARYESLVYAVATRSGLTYHEAADCFQQTWASLYASRKRIKDPSRISAWLVTTAKRQVIRTIKRRPIEPSDDPWNEMADSNPLPDADLKNLQLRTHVKNALEEIDSRCQKLLRLLFYAPEDLSYNEVAKELNISTNALGPARKRCLERLRKIIEKDGLLDALI